MAAAACAVQILMSRPTEAVYDIERASARGHCGRARKRDDAEGLPGAWHSEALYRDARQSRIDSSCVGFAVSCEDGHVFARPREFMSNLPRDIFDSAGTRRETFDYDCDAQCGNPLAFAREYPLQLALASEPQVRRIPPRRACGWRVRLRNSFWLGWVQVTETERGETEAVNDASSAIEVEGLSKRYGDFEAVRDLSFQIGAGEVVGFLGPNGAGKTTTMRMLTGFIPPTNGSIRIAGFDIFAEGLDARRSIGYLPETPPLYPEMTPKSYIEFVAKLKDVARAKRKDAVDRALDLCGLQDVRSREIRQLSKGYRQRVGLAQAIVHDPQVLVLDEPTVGLDPMQIREIRSLIRDLAATGGQTILLSTHILAEVEAICQRVILIQDGRKVLDQPLTELIAGGTSLEEVFARAMSREEPEEGEAA